MTTDENTMGEEYWEIVQIRDVNEESGAVLIVLGRNLDHKRVDGLKQILNKELDSGSMRLVVDLSNQNFIYSAHIGVIWAACLKARQGGGDIKFINLKDSVRAAFDTLGLTKAMSLYDTAQEAFDAFSAQS